MIKPDFAVVVLAIPICWNKEAVNKKKPQNRPPMHSFFFCVFVNGVFFSVLIIKGLKVIRPNQLLVAKKVKGPTESAPILCATNAIPQIKAVKIKSPK